MDGIISTVNQNQQVMFSPSNNIGTRKLKKKLKFIDLYKTINSNSGWSKILKTDKKLRAENNKKNYLKLGGKYRIPTVEYSIN